ncbi:DUF302 domain-containing protein [Laceyella putida]|uniref:DUF302 domain-containing protein n=2 Tax=Laceyella putida TaxID=110101 RepID=A0ABW2RGC0_9BACL
MESIRLEMAGTVEQAIRLVERHLPEEKCILLWKYDVATKLLEQGIHLEQETVILEVSQPDLTKKLLSLYPHAAYLLPLKLTVTRHPAKELVEVKLVRASMLASLEGDDAARQLVEEMEDKLVRVMKRCEEQWQASA